MHELPVVGVLTLVSVKIQVGSLDTSKISKKDIKKTLHIKHLDPFSKHPLLMFALIRQGELLVPWHVQLP